MLGGDGAGGEVPVVTGGEGQQAPVTGQAALARTAAPGEPVVGALQHGAQLLGIRQLGEIAGAARDQVVEQQCLPSRARVADLQGGQVVRGSAVGLPQAELDGGDQARQGERIVSVGDLLGQSQQDRLRGEATVQQHILDVFVGVGAVLAPGTVLVAGVDQATSVQVPAAGADPKQRRLDPFPRDHQLGGGVAARSQVQPSQVQLPQIGEFEAGAGEPPPLDPVRVDVGDAKHREPGQLAFVRPVVDARLLASHIGRHLRQLDAPETLPAIPDARLFAARAADVLLRSGGVAGQLLSIAAVRAQPQGPDGVALGSDVDGVDADLVAADVERGAGREIGEGAGTRPGVGALLQVAFLGLGVAPGHGDVELDGVVDKAVVGQQPLPLQRRHPVLVPGFAELAPDETQLRLGLAQRLGVLLAVGLPGP